MKGAVISENAYALILCITSKIDRETALKSCGIEIPFSQRGAATKPSIIPKEDKEKIHDWYYKKNMTLNDIGQIYDVSPVTVKNFLKKMGIPIKPRGRYTIE